MMQTFCPKCGQRTVNLISSHIEINPKTNSNENCNVTTYFHSNGSTCILKEKITEEFRRDNE